MGRAAPHAPTQPFTNGGPQPSLPSSQHAGPIPPGGRVRVLGISLTPGRISQSPSQLQPPPGGGSKGRRQRRLPPRSHTCGGLQESAGRRSGRTGSSTASPEAGRRPGRRKDGCNSKGEVLGGNAAPLGSGRGAGAADAPGDGGRWLSPCSSGATVHAPAVLPHSALPPPPRGAATRSRAGLRASALSKGGSPSRRLPPGPWPHAQPALEGADPHPAPPHRLSKFAGWRPDRRRGLCAAGVGVEGIRPVPASGSGSSRVSSQRLRQVK